METIYKVKIKTKPDPITAYPSERRYSASKVLGFSVIHIILAIIAFIMAILTLKTLNLHQNHNDFNSTDYVLSSQENIVRKKGQEDLQLTSISIAPCVMAVGALAAGLLGLLAWKRWYIDNNIKWFFISSCVSIGTSFLSLIILTVIYITYQDVTYAFLKHKGIPHFRMTLSINIFLVCTFEFFWSFLSTLLSYKGMKNEYPEDIISSRMHGVKQVSTVFKGNKKDKSLPPDILNHFPKSSKIARLFPKGGEIESLAKVESNAEYKERVQKFLSAGGKE